MLPVVLILLGAVALMLLFAQRNLLLDLRITKNAYGHRLAYAVADAGLSAVLVRLNDPVQRRELLVDRQKNGSYDQILQPEIRVTLTEQNVASIKLSAVGLGGPDIRLHVQSTGCIADCQQARATVNQILAMRGGIHRIPYALLTARGSIDLVGAVTLNNQAPAVNGMLLHAGRRIARDESVQRYSLPGKNPDTAEFASDIGLSQLTADRYFEAWFGADKNLIQRASTRITCNGDCSSGIVAAGSRVIWLEGNARLNSGTIGSVAAPVVIIASGALHLGDSVKIFGVVYSMAASTEIQMTSGRIEGAVIAENNLSVGQGGVFTYNPTLLQAAQTHLGTFIPVPGTWGDGG